MPELFSAIPTSELPLVAETIQSEIFVLTSGTLSQATLDRIDEQHFLLSAIGREQHSRQISG